MEFTKVPVLLEDGDSYVVAGYTYWKQLVEILEGYKQYLVRDDDISDLNGWIQFIDFQVEDNLFVNEDEVERDWVEDD